MVQSFRAKPYDAAVQGIHSRIGSRSERLILAEVGKDRLMDRIHAMGAKLILAVGRDALVSVGKTKTLPIVYCMVLNPHAIVGAQENITGVSMRIRPYEQLSLLRRALPCVQTIGLLYDPRRTGLQVKRAREVARKLGLHLIAKEIAHAEAVPQAVSGFKKAIDLFWMLPDITVVRPETVEYLLVFSLENRIPIFAFSEKYVEMGALISVGIDPFDIGVQAAEMVRMILSGKDVQTVARVDARKPVVSINPKVAQKLEITIAPSVARKARIVQ